MLLINIIKLYIYKYKQKIKKLEDEISQKNKELIDKQRLYEENEQLKTQIQKLEQYKLTQDIVDNVKKMIYEKDILEKENKELQDTIKQIKEERRRDLKSYTDGILKEEIIVKIKNEKDKYKKALERILIVYIINNLGEKIIKFY